MVLPDYNANAEAVSQKGQGTGGWPGYVSEEPVTQEKRKKGWRKVVK